MARLGGLERQRDALVPLLVLVVCLVEAATFGPPELVRVALLELVACAALVPRRRHPVLGATASLLLLVVLSRTGPAADELAAPLLVVLLAGFALGRWLPGLRGLAVLVPALVVLVTGLGRSDPTAPDVTDVVFVAAVLLPPWLVGRLVRALAERGDRLAEQAELLARLSATVREDAVSAERTRIARELHDVLAHSISAMVVQAAAGEELVRRDPDRAAGAMRQVADTGREALSETGRLLALVRDAEGQLGRAPEPGLDRLEDLVGQFRRSGLDVELHVDGALGRLPGGVDLSAYRIVQEALTNALRHGTDRCLRLRVSRRDGRLRITAENAALPGPSAGSGLGLLGMAERASLFGGSLEAGLGPDGVFRLRAELPLERAPV